MILFFFFFKLHLVAKNLNPPFLLSGSDCHSYTRVNEHAKSDKSEVYNHVHDCEHFEHVLSLLNLPCNLLDVKYTINIVDLIFDNCYIIDRSNNWSLLLFKEAYHIRRCDPSLNHDARASKELTIFR